MTALKLISLKSVHIFDRIILQNYQIYILFNSVNSVMSYKSHVTIKAKVKNHPRAGVRHLRWLFDIITNNIQDWSTVNLPNVENEHFAKFNTLMPSTLTSDDIK